MKAGIDVSPLVQTQAGTARYLRALLAHNEYTRLSWGGSAHRGSNTGLPSNDDDGNFGPPFPDALLSAGTDAVLFKGAAHAKSTTNAHDYAVTPGAATFTNSSGESFVVTP